MNSEPLTREQIEAWAIQQPSTAEELRAAALQLYDRLREIEVALYQVADRYLEDPTMRVTLTANQNGEIPGYDIAAAIAIKRIEGLAAEIDRLRIENKLLRAQISSRDKALDRLNPFRKRSQ